MWERCMQLDNRTYNVLLHQLENVRWSIIGLSEVLYSGRSDKSHKEGVALVLQKEASKALIRYEAAGFMILKAKFLLESNNHTAVCPNITINRRGDRRILHRSKLSESGLDDSYMGFQLKGWIWHTWIGALGNVKNQFKSSVPMCRALSKPDIASYDKLALTGLRIKLKTIQKERCGKRFDV